MAGIAEVKDLVERHTNVEGVCTTAIPRLSLYRFSRMLEALHGVYEPSVCIVVQGRKRVIAGEHLCTYDVENYLLVSADVPVVGQVLEASRDHPFLAMLMHLDAATLAELMLETDVEEPNHGITGSALAVSTVEPDLLDACARLLRLLDSPEDVPVLAPLVEREILYRLLRGGQSQRLSQLATTESRLHDIKRSIGCIRENYREPLSVEALASEARMSTSALYHHFRAVTGLSPLQYQKHLRLQEARRLMLGGEMNAATAGYSVGYESPSQFSREYRRLFGAPPARDIARLPLSSLEPI
ncbi:AraC family transcriptional regulator CmrA [Halovibrio salipaludis]|uniref:AraC family transcriptional regulator CmrA n=1 Tax=Halovibrio salipaludis TaxID=2032626 RepID=A0A2A2F6U8_9GAMM|nr:AraC family transcriptional regulator [Halovibrio salipaludis]PAU80454.1 AraC family transcriptional regulator CmrA [Halovibrio salipaludis]